MQDIAAAILICEANRGSESVHCTFEAFSDSKFRFLANIRYTLPTYGSQSCLLISILGPAMPVVFVHWLRQVAVCCPKKEEGGKQYKVSEEQGNQKTREENEAA